MSSDKSDSSISVEQLLSVSPWSPKSKARLAESLSSLSQVPLPKRAQLGRDLIAVLQDNSERISRRGKAAVLLGFSWKEFAAEGANDIPSALLAVLESEFTHSRVYALTHTSPSEKRCPDASYFLLQMLVTGLINIRSPGDLPELDTLRDAVRNSKFEDWMQRALATRARRQ
jgi:hypothetical protein